MNYIIQKARGGFIRSRAKWIEDGEKKQHSSVVLRKEDKKQKTTSLTVNNKEIADDKLISSEIFKFYSAPIYTPRSFKED